MSAQYRPGRPASVRDALCPIRLTFFSIDALRSPYSHWVWQQYASAIWDDALGSIHKGNALTVPQGQISADLCPQVAIPPLMDGRTATPWMSCTVLAPGCFCGSGCS